MRCLTACLACLLAVGGPLAAEAPAAAASGPSAFGVALVSPPDMVSSPFMNSEAIVTGADSAETCIQRHVDELAQPQPKLPVACNLVTYVIFWVDLASPQRRHPKPYGGCPSAPSSCQFMGQDDQAPYSMVERYDGPGGRHTATAQAWRYVWGDAEPVLLGQDSKRFCLRYCNGS